MPNISCQQRPDHFVELHLVAAWYRNHYKDVRRFLEHQKSKGSGTYKVYNLTAERPIYHAEKLGGELANFPFEDHQVRPLLSIEVMKTCYKSSKSSMSCSLPYA